MGCRQSPAMAPVSLCGQSWISGRVGGLGDTLNVFTCVLGVMEPTCQELQTPDLVSSDVSLCPDNPGELRKMRLKKGHDLNPTEAMGSVLAIPWRETEAKPEEA